MEIHITLGMIRVKRTMRTIPIGRSYMLKGKQGTFEA